MKKVQLFGAIALALMICLNASVFLEANDWETSTEVAYASTDIVNTPAPIPGPGTVAITFDAREVIFNCPPQAPQNFFRGCLLSPSDVCRRTSCW